MVHGPGDREVRVKKGVGECITGRRTLIGGPRGAPRIRVPNCSKRTGEEISEGSFRCG